ncbi:MAG: hypothetical protein ACRBN8_18565 [Nannocystales bacterium]
MGAGRLIKGIDLVGLVKSLRVARSDNRLQGLDPSDLELIDQRVLLSNWYPLDHFRRVLLLNHRHIQGGTNEAARAMGEFGAKTALEGAHSVFLHPGDPLQTLRGMATIWSAHFNFGEINVHVDGNTVRVVVQGYDDMEVLHGTLLFGWITKAAELAGAQIETSKIEESPWHGADCLVVMMRLGSLEPTRPS